ncbi:hypothetical protein ACMFMG_008480 [Clarireedia jacksonii]
MEGQNGDVDDRRDRGRSSGGANNRPEREGQGGNINNRRDRRPHGGDGNREHRNRAGTSRPESRENRLEAIRKFWG